MFNGSIYYILYLQILCFYLVWQIKTSASWVGSKSYNGIKSDNCIELFFVVSFCTLLQIIIFCLSLAPWECERDVSAHGLCSESLFVCLFVLCHNNYVMLSRKISLKSNMWHFQFFIWLKLSFGEVHFVENPTWIRPVVSKLQAIEWLSKQYWIENERNSFLFLALSHNQCPPLLTDSSR